MLLLIDTEPVLLTSEFSLLFSTTVREKMT